MATTNDISIYFQPIGEELSLLAKSLDAQQMGMQMSVYSSDDGFPEWQNANIAILGVCESRGAINNEGCGKAPDEIRKYFYKLFKGNYTAKIVDLGNIQEGHEINDTYFAVSSAVKELVKQNVVVVILGGGQDITYANYKAYENLEQVVNLVTVDNMFDLGSENEECSSRSHLSKIILHQPSFLFNYSNIGYQTYFANQQEIDLMTKLYFDSHRLGNIQKNFEDAEPIIRNADMLSMDISSIRMSDAPGNNNATPNGFYGEEACQLARYAGFSDKLSSFGLYELNPAMDRNGQTAHLSAQIVWYFIEGYYNRKQDAPTSASDEYVKYRVSLTNHNHEIVFLKSKKSDRWWMNVPYPPDKKLKFERHHLVPCTYSDYTTACSNEMPDRWWQTFQKLC